MATDDYDGLFNDDRCYHCGHSRGNHIISFITSTESKTSKRRIRLGVKSVWCWLCPREMGVRQVCCYKASRQVFERLNATAVQR